MSCLHQPPQIFRKCIYFRSGFLLVITFILLTFTNVPSSEGMQSKAAKVISSNRTDSQALDKGRAGCLDPLPTTDASPRGLSHQEKRTHLRSAISHATALPRTRRHGRQRSPRGTSQLWNPRETATKTTAADLRSQPYFREEQGSEGPLRATVFEHSPSPGIAFKGRRSWIRVWLAGEGLDFFFRKAFHTVCIHSMRSS